METGSAGAGTFIRCWCNVGITAEGGTLPTGKLVACGFVSAVAHRNQHSYGTAFPPSLP